MSDPLISSDAAIVFCFPGNGWGINAGLSAGGQPPAKKDVWGASEPFGATTATTNGNDVWGSSGFSTSGGL